MKPYKSGSKLTSSSHQRGLKMYLNSSLIIVPKINNYTKNESGY